MLFALAIFACLSAANGDNFWYKTECSENAERAISFDPSKDGVPGRYVLRCCTAGSPPPIQWDLELKLLKFPAEKCNMDLDKGLHRSKGHSQSVEQLNLTTSCPYVCLSQTMDLVYQSCYWITNMVTRQNDNKTFKDWQRDLYLYVNNSIPQYTLSNAGVFAECYDVGEKVVCTWLQGKIPYTQYTMYLYPNDDDQIATGKDVTENCTRLDGAIGSVRCEFYVAPGAYRLEIRFIAPWAHSMLDLAHQYAHFNYTPSQVTVDPPAPSSASLWWIFGVCAVLAISLLSALMVYQKRVDAKKKLKKWQEWKDRNKVEAEPKEEDPLEVSTEAASVLLLYARDCPAAQRVASALLTLLQQHHAGQVFDLYSPEITARAAKSPAAFVRECMTSPHIIVVLLQTPALAALHTVRLAGVDTLRLEEPLLPARVMYRSPMFGDTLLQYALQLMRETQPASPYRKYKLATLSALSVDAFPSIVPYTRYSLPLDVLSLAHSLSPNPPNIPPNPPLLSPLAAACEELVEYVTDNPNYLAEQIMFL